jgi:hypothetical protein
MPLRVRSDPQLPNKMMQREDHAEATGVLPAIEAIRPLQESEWRRSYPAWHRAGLCPYGVTGYTDRSDTHQYDHGLP